MITIFIPTFNCEETIRECLESAKWADRIFVVDSFSTDGTLDICREYTDWIVQHEYIYSASQKNWGMEQINTEWTMQLDSDEEIEPALREEILLALTQENLPDGFRIRRKNYIWGVWTKCCGLYPDAQVRLFHSQKGRWSDRQVHARVQGLDTVHELKNHIIHQDMTDLSAELQQFSRQVVVWESNELVKQGRHWRWRDVTIRPAIIFFIYYILKKGFREGFRGFYLAVYRAFYSFMTYARLYEIERYTNNVS